MYYVPSTNRLRLASILGVGALLGLAMLSALLIAASQWILLIGLYLLVALFFLVLFTSTGMEDQRGWMLATGWIVMLFTQVLRAWNVPFGYILEFFIFGIAFVVVRQLWRLCAHDKTLRALLILLVIYFGFSLLSTVLGRSKPLAALWQLQYNLKWPIMLGIGTLIVWNSRVERSLRGIFAWSWLVLVPVVALEAIAPGVHKEIFGLRPDANTNPILGLPLRYRGPFGHPGYLAITSAFLAAGSFAQLLRGRNWRWLALTAVYGGLVLASGQRQELLALFACGLLFVVFAWRRHLYLLIPAAGAFAVCIAATFILLDYVPMRNTLEQWGVIGSTVELSERAVLTAKSFDIAERYFPLGAGLGTYAGAGAQKFDLSLFWELGFGRYWWFLRGKFILDTYWPNIAGESGVFGAIALMSFFSLMWLALFRRAWHANGTEAYELSFLGLCGLTLLILNTPSSPMLTDPRGAFVFWLVIGCAWRALMSKSVSSPYRQPQTYNTQGLRLGTAKATGG